MRLSVRVLGHLSIYLYAGTASGITCLISRWPNSPPPPAPSPPLQSRCVVLFILMQARKKCLQFGLTATPTPDPAVAVAPAVSLFLLATQWSGSQIKNVCPAMSAFHFSCWSLNCLRHDATRDDTCHKVAVAVDVAETMAETWTRVRVDSAFCVK